MSKSYDSLIHPLYSWEDAMKRDMDLVRILLLKIEESDDPELMDLSVEGYTNNPKGRVPRALPVGE